MSATENRPNPDESCEARRGFRERKDGVYFGAFFLVMLLMGVLMQTTRSFVALMPWIAIAVGAVLAVIFFAYIRWGRARVRRQIASGDYDNRDVW